MIIVKIFYSSRILLLFYIIILDHLEISVLVFNSSLIWKTSFIELVYILLNSPIANTQLNYF